jgi:hypothetical protein
MIMLFNQLLDMPHLSGGWIILLTNKEMLTNRNVNKFQRNKLYMRIVHFWDLKFYCIYVQYIVAL